MKRLTLRQTIFFTFAMLAILNLNTGLALADAGHGHDDGGFVDEGMMKGMDHHDAGSEHQDKGSDHHDAKSDKHEKEQDSHHHAPIIRKKATYPEGTKEVVIDLAGPFCSRHPEEIQATLMKSAGVLHVEAFDSRDYILVKYNPEKVQPAAMAATLIELKGSGWRCNRSSVSTRKRTER